jgi:hypothetical protein
LILMAVWHPEEHPPPDTQRQRDPHFGDKLNADHAAAAYLAADALLDAKPPSGSTSWRPSAAGAPFKGRHAVLQQRQLIGNMRRKEIPPRGKHLAEFNPQQQIEKAMGGLPVEAWFDDFSVEPLASASIAQVHTARAVAAPSAPGGR